MGIQYLSLPEMPLIVAMYVAPVRAPLGRQLALEIQKTLILALPNTVVHVAVLDFMDKTRELT